LAFCVRLEILLCHKWLVRFGCPQHGQRGTCAAQMATATSPARGHLTVFERPLLPDAALAYVADWLAHPVARAVGPGDRHWAILRNLLEQAGTAGNLTTDAHIAALALEQGYAICSANNDFKRLPDLKQVNPLAA